MSCKQCCCTKKCCNVFDATHLMYYTCRKNDFLWFNLWFLLLKVYDKYNLVYNEHHKLTGLMMTKKKKKNKKQKSMIVARYFFIELR